MDRRDFIKASLVAGMVGSRAAAEPIAGAIPPGDIAAARFPMDFLWGTATSAFQVEGAWDTDGKSESIWDHFAHAGRLAGKANGDVACDQYHRFKGDIALMQQLHMKSHRFSISWPRVLPYGTGAVNQKGIDYYSRFVDALLEAGIRPFCTLYHWDLPQALEDKGSWPNRDLAKYFADYAGLMAKYLGDRITVWAPFNMPWSVARDGYGTGWAAPGKKDFALFWKAAHTIALAHGEAYRALKAASSNATVGSAFEQEPVIAKSNSKADRAAAARFVAFHNRFFFNAAMRGEYPAAVGEQQRHWMGFKPGDEKIMRTQLDWVGVHYYLRLMISDSGSRTNSLDPLDGVRVELPRQGPKMQIGWEMWPEAFYGMLMEVSREYGHPSIEITETGLPYPAAQPLAAQMHDHERLNWYRQHLAALARALKDGAKVRAYHAWTLMDNLEWQWGYTRRMGIAYTDFSTLKRTLKDSGHWYGRVAAAGRLAV